MLYPLSYEGGDGAERGAKLGATARKPWGKGSSGVLGRSKLSDGYAHQVARVVPSDARAFHPAGLTDPSGFVAMSLDGLLVHTSDVVKALGGAFHLSDDLVSQCSPSVAWWRRARSCRGKRCYGRMVGWRCVDMRIPPAGQSDQVAAWSGYRWASPPQTQ